MLWIVTQDNQRLVNVKEITVQGKKLEGVFGSGLLDVNLLGKYDSKERAEEILREIYTEIEENTHFSVTYSMPEQ